VDAGWLLFGDGDVKRAARGNQAARQHPTPLGREEGQHSVRVAMTTSDDPEPRVVNVRMGDADDHD
jgi:hypothetical protein